MQVWSTTGTSMTAESTAVCRYSDLAISKGIIPVLYQCWVNHPQDYVYAKPAWDSCYAHYKSRGMLIAPLMDMHNAINAEKPVTYLYMPGDAYLHPSQNGVFLTVSSFVCVFTNVKPSAFDLSVMATCTENAGVPAEKSYLAAKAEAAFAKFAGQGGTPIRNTVRGEAVGKKEARTKAVVGFGNVGMNSDERLFTIRGAKIDRCRSGLRMVTVRIAE
jgi:hypothetical protein